MTTINSRIINNVSTPVRGFISRLFARGASSTKRYTERAAARSKRITAKFKGWLAAVAAASASLAALLALHTLWVVTVEAGILAGVLSMAVDFIVLTYLFIIFALVMWAMGAVLWTLVASFFA